jgi:hypothetical protein
MQTEISNPSELSHPTVRLTAAAKALLACERVSTPASPLTEVVQAAKLR